MTRWPRIAVTLRDRALVLLLAGCGGEPAGGPPADE